MSMRISTLTLAVAVLIVAAAAGPGYGQQKAVDPGVAMKTGKDLFEKSCKLCHGLDRSLTVNRDAAGWEKAVKRMVTYGTPLNAEQRPLVVKYLATRSLFAARCAACHDATRVVGDTPGARDWKALTTRMAGHVRDLERDGKAPAGVTFSPEDLSDIAAFLGAVLP